MKHIKDIKKKIEWEKYYDPDFDWDYDGENDEQKMEEDPFQQNIQKIDGNDNEVDLSQNKISNESPIGAALMGAKKNQIVEVNAPAGIIKYKVLSITK